MTSDQHGPVRGLVDVAAMQGTEYAINFYADGGCDYRANIDTLNAIRANADAHDAQVAQLVAAAEALYRSAHDGDEMDWDDAYGNLRAALDAMKEGQGEN